MQLNEPLDLRKVFKSLRQQIKYREPYQAFLRVVHYLPFLTKRTFTL